MYENSLFFFCIEYRDCANVECSKKVPWNQLHCSDACVLQQFQSQHTSVEVKPNCSSVVKAHAFYEGFVHEDRLFTNFLIPLSTSAYNILKDGFFFPKPVQNEELHHDLRRRYLTASNVAAVLGCNPYCSQRAVFQKYVLRDSGKDNYFMRQGREYEPFIARKFVQYTQIPCIYNQGLAISKEHPFLGASFDLLTIEGIPVEIKFMVSRKPTKKELLPFMYWIQCQVQMQVAKAPFCYYVEYKEEKGDEKEYFNIIRLARDDAWFSSVIAKLQTFWHEVCLLRSGLSKQRN